MKNPTGTIYTKSTITQLPDEPGVYQFYNTKKVIIYVGKAKNIKNRVNHYFSGTQLHTIKTQRMVAAIATISCTVVNSEYEALLLENNLIKSLQPRYNILLKDGKTYPYLCITNERFPKIIITRKVETNLGHYYGPFTSSQAIYQVLTLIKKLYPLRTCSHNLSTENIAKKKFKVCLDYHLGTCKGPCVGLQNMDNYNESIAQVKQFLKNDLYDVKQTIKTKMQKAAIERDYKNAQHYKEKLLLLENYQSKSLVANPKLGDLDIVGMIADAEHAFISYLQIQKGGISFTNTLVIKKQLDEKEVDLLPLIICNLRAAYHSQAKEVFTNLPIEIDLELFTISSPKIGDKKKLVDLAIKNAFLCKKAFFLQQTNYEKRCNSLLCSLQRELQLKDLPVHIECFDNSNLQGSDPVAAMVSFKDGKPYKSGYRHFHIKTVVGADDFASMYEVVKRRYQRLVEESAPLPQLIVIDGGKGQLNAAVRGMKEVGVYGKIAVIALAKRLEEIFYPSDTLPIHVSKKSPALKLLQRIRNETHRFAITFHRNKRSNNSLESQLSQIAGIGPKTIQKLFSHFKTMDAIKGATKLALEGQIGRTKAAILIAAFKQ